MVSSRPLSSRAPIFRIAALLRAVSNAATSDLHPPVMDDQPSKKAKVVDSRGPAPPEPAFARINVVRIGGETVAAPELPLTSTAAELKERVAEITGTPAPKFSLALGEIDMVRMEDARSLAEHGMEASGFSEEVVKVTMIIDGFDLETDKEALVALYNSTNGAQWRNKTGWLTDAPVGEWFGVTVEGERVVKLTLGFNNLQGENLCSTRPTQTKNISKPPLRTSPNLPATPGDSS